MGHLNLVSFVAEVSGSVFQVDKGFFFTIKELFVRPGHSIREYLLGKRKRHFKPVACVLTLSTIYFLLSRLTESETMVTSFIEGYASGIDSAEANSEKLETFRWFGSNYAYTMLMLLPLFFCFLAGLLENRIQLSGTFRAQCLHHGAASHYLCFQLHFSAFSGY